MRCIDADALEKEGWSLHRTIRVDMNTEEYQTKPLRQVPTIEPERKFTDRELKVFAHGISLKLLSKKSAQHWHYEDKTAEEIEFLEGLYEKVKAEMEGEG